MFANPLVWLRLGAAAAVFGAGLWTGIQVEEGARDSLIRSTLEAAAEQAQAVIAKERQQHNQISQTLQDQADEQRTINTRLADDLVRLRDRAARMPRASEADCKGADGSELSGPDAGFLVREAARADELRAALRACYEYADSISNTKGSTDPFASK